MAGNQEMMRSNDSKPKASKHKSIKGTTNSQDRDERVSQSAMQEVREVREMGDRLGNSIRQNHDEGSTQGRDNPGCDLGTQDFEVIDRPGGNPCLNYDERHAAKLQGDQLGNGVSQDVDGLTGRDLKEDRKTKDFRGSHTEQRPTRPRDGRHQQPENCRSKQVQGHCDNVDDQQEPRHNLWPRDPKSRPFDILQHPQNDSRDKDFQKYDSQGCYRPPTEHSSFHSNTHTEVYENKIRNDGVYLPLVEYEVYQKLSAELEKARRQVVELEQVLKEERVKLDRIEKSALARVDRFQPAFDTEIKGLYKTLDQQVLGVCKKLHDLIPRKQPDQWPQEARWKSFIQPVKFSDKTSRRLVLTGVVWKFLVDNIFEQRFSCFGEDLSRKVNDVHAELFASHGVIEETEESARWRAETAAYLMHKYPFDSGASIPQSNLQKQLEEILNVGLGYESIAKTEASIKIKRMIEDAENFKRKLMQQRAVFETFVPDPRSGENKAQDDEILSNNVEDDGKAAGKIWFVIKPGLIKRGTGRGTDFNDSAAQTVIMPAFVQLK